LPGDVVAARRLDRGVKKLFIKTYGCQMNVYDSDRMVELLAPHGYVPVDKPEGADLVILNTCHIREKAGEKVYSELGRLRALKQARPDMKVAVAGCVAQAEGAEMIRRQDLVDLVVGPQSYHRLPELLARAGGRVATEFPADSKFDSLPEAQTRVGVSAFLTVQEGCDKFCTFCVVPYTRGGEYSRPVAAVEREARALVARGAVEITLLGQNVNAYHGVDERQAVLGLGALIGRLAQIEGLARLRYTTSHPRDMDDALIEAHAREAKLMPYLHLPVQSGADRVLHAMNRGHSADDYRRLVDRLRRARPDLALSSDFIVGFPGESDVEFAATLALSREIGFASAYSFKYSRRPGTPAAADADQVPEDVKDERLQILQAVLQEQQQRFASSMVGRRVEVLLEKPGRHARQMVGRSPWLHSVHLSAEGAAIGEIVTARIDRVGPNSLAGQRVDSTARRMAV
jgi:tRNA-2-methylthio-N6-dimethylallyladenosine synthase